MAAAGPSSRTNVSASTEAVSIAVTAADDLDDPTAVGGDGENNSDGEDEVPDYLRLMSLTSKSGSASAGVIPKRGEKDFEPTGFGGQTKLLEKSREAMYQAVSGERRVGARSLVRATWDPSTCRAVLHDLQGKIFETIGVISRTTRAERDPTGKQKMVTTARNELLPEEALFLVERGSLQLYSLPSSRWTGELDVSRQAPMSLQQAFTELLHADRLTREKYLIYTYLKRLGYVVQRASVVDAARAAPLTTLRTKAEAKGIIADPQRPIRLVKIWDLLLYAPRRLAQLLGDAMGVLVRLFRRLVASIGALGSRLSHGMFSRLSSLGATRSHGGSSELSKGLLGIQRWDSFDAVFHSLQIVPANHDSPTPHCSTLVPDTVAKAELEPFYYAWRPATVYRKSHPPPPEFRIVIVNARSQSLPSLWEFEHLFSTIPIAGSDEELYGTVDVASQPSLNAGGDAQDERARRLAYERDIKAKNDLKNRAAYGRFSEGKQKFLAEKAEERKQQYMQRQQNREAQMSAWTKATQGFWRTWFGIQLWKTLLLDFTLLRHLARLFRHAPPGCFVSNGQTSRSRKGRGGNKPVNVFPLLKAGRRSVVLAVVDGSISTLLRFGEAEFATWKLAGHQPEPST